MTAQNSAKRNFTAPMLTACLLGAMLLLANHAAPVAALLADRVTLCLQTLIPSLFGCMALANLLRAGGAGAWLGNRLRHTAALLRMSPPVFGIFLISQLAGYPVGTLLLRQAADAGQISAKDAARLSAVCFGGGPAFLVGLAGAQLFGSAAAGWAMLTACILANFILALLLRRAAPAAESTQTVHTVCRLSPEMITGAVSGAMYSLAQICGIVLFFGILIWLTEILDFLPLLVRLGGCFGITPQTVRAVFAAVMDITQLSGVFHCGLSYAVLLPLTAALLSFGGICVHWQCLAVGVPALRWHTLLGMRLAAALLTAGFMVCCTPLIRLPEELPVFAHHAAVSRSGSVLPALLILCTGFPLFFSSGGKRVSTKHA